VSPTAIRPPGSSPSRRGPGGRRRRRWRICKSAGGGRRATASLSKAIYVSEQVCIRWHSTGAYYTAKLTFSHDFPIKVRGAYCTSVRIIFEFLRYFHLMVIFPAEPGSDGFPLDPPNPPLQLSTKRQQQQRKAKKTCHRCQREI